MKYKIELDYIAGGCGVTFYPDETFAYFGTPIEACNFKVAQILEKNEEGINRSNLVGARIYKDRKVLLGVDYRLGKLEMNVGKLDNFWIKI